MAHVPLQLWKLESKVLNGFYQSMFVVIAATREEAVDKVMEAFETHVQECFDMMFMAGSFQLLDEDGKAYDTVSLDSTDEEELAKYKPLVLRSLRQEAEANLEIVEAGALALHSA